MEDVDKAIATYLQVLDDEPSDPKALAALDILYQRLGRWEPYVEVLHRRIELDLGEEELVDLKFRLGQTLEKHLSDEAGALRNYREILFVDSQHEGARVALEAMLGGKLRGEGAAILEPIYEDGTEWASVIRALESLSGEEPDVQKC